MTAAAALAEKSVVSTCQDRKSQITRARQRCVQEESHTGRIAIYTSGACHAVVKLIAASDIWDPWRISSP